MVTKIYCHVSFFTQGRIQFFIDAVDRAVSHRQQFEMEAIINRFPIDLELELGASFTERTTYTGIYNISGLGFDMSFRVQCSENYYGPNCNRFCEGVYTCDSQGRVVCVYDNQDPATNCTTCHTQAKSDSDSLNNCSMCFFSGQDLQSHCIRCIPGFTGNKCIIDSTSSG